jgi:hypothetical protein
LSLRRRLLRLPEVAVAAGWRRRLESNGRLRTEVGKEVPNLETTSYFLARGLFGARTVIARRAPVMDALSEAFLTTIVCIVASLWCVRTSAGRAQCREETQEHE